MIVHQKALHLLEQDDWDAAHKTIQDESDVLSCLIHGLLHRIEGDIGNAAYWYRRAGEDLSRLSVEDELVRLKKLSEGTA